MSLELQTKTAQIVSAYVAGNAVDTNAMAALIEDVFHSLSILGEPVTVAEPQTSKLTNAQIKKSNTGEVLISFEDGKSYKSLKRHLSKRGLSPDEYRTKWGLPKDYPMVAASYSAARSALAKKMGLGSVGGKLVAMAEATTPAKAVKKAGRPKKAAPSEV